MDHFEDIGPSVVMASPGMMQSGLSRELFESWCTDKRNGVIIAGYCVEGTLAKVRTLSPRSCFGVPTKENHTDAERLSSSLQHVLSEPDEVVTMVGQKLPLRCSVDYISFSAHTDYQQTSEFIRTLKPTHIVSVFNILVSACLCCKQTAVQTLASVSHLQGAGARRTERDESAEVGADPRVRGRPRVQHRHPQPQEHHVRRLPLQRRKNGQGIRGTTLGYCWLNVFHDCPCIVLCVSCIAVQ